MNVTRPSEYYNPRLVVAGTAALADRVNDELNKIQAGFDLIHARFATATGGAGISGFTWRAWSDSADGSQNFTTVAPGERAYLGLAFNRAIEAPSQQFVDYVWTRIRGDKGDTAPGFAVEYSVDGNTNWHFPYAAGDRFIRQSNDGGATFGPAARISAATLAELDIAAANALAAAGADIVALNSRVGTNEAAVTAEASTRLTETTALSNLITALTATVGANAAAVTQSITAQASTNTATAATLTTLTTTLNSQTTQISAFQTTMNGVMGEVGLTINANGLITGYRVFNNSRVGGAVFDVDTFGLGRPDGSGVYPFRLENGTIFIKEAVIQDLTIGTTKLANNATFASAVFYGDFGGFRRANPQYNIWYDTVDQRASIDAVLTLARDGGDDDNTSWRVLRSDGVILPQVYNNVQISNGRRQYPFSFYDDNIPAGASLRYKIQWLALPNDGFPSFFNVLVRGVLYKK
jgi:hypothetical protein